MGQCWLLYTIFMFCSKNHQYITEGGPVRGEETQLKCIQISIRLSCSCWIQFSLILINRRDRARLWLFCHKLGEMIAWLCSARTADAGDNKVGSPLPPPPPPPCTAAESNKIIDFYSKFDNLNHRAELGRALLERPSRPICVEKTNSAS